MVDGDPETPRREPRADDTGTEREQSAGSDQESDERAPEIGDGRPVDYHEVFRKLSDGVLLHDPETGEVLEANPAMCEMTGYDREEMLGTSVSEFSAVEAGYTDEKARERIHTAAREGPQVFEWLDETRDGEQFWVEVNLRRTEFDGEDCVLAVVRDIDDRKSLERSLESLQSATDHLIRARSKREAAERTVEAAQQVLSFPVLGVHLYDEAERALEPVAHTDAADEVLDGAPPTITDSESPTWQAFAAGEPTHYEDVHRAVDVEDPSSAIRTQLVLPLGSHGVLVVGDPEPGGFDDDQVELAEILAANAEAAMNHAEGRRRLQERERQLQRETQRAQRLERRNRIVRDIEAALVEESTRAGIERAVCDRLVAVDQFEYAWVGGTEPGSERPVPRTRSGGGDDPLDCHFEDAPENHPAVAAVQADEAVVRELLPDAPGGEWRRRALTAGYRSVCAVPLSYDGVVHGVVTVYAAEADAFEGRARETLAELGRSIGYALTAVERRRALESDATTELEFRVRDAELLPVELADRSGHRVELERSIRRSGSEVSVFYTVTADRPIDADALLAVEECRDDVTEAKVVNEDGDSCLLECVTDRWFGTPFADHGAVVRSAIAEDGEAKLLVETSSGTDVRALVDAFRDRFEDVELLAHREGGTDSQTPGELWDRLGSELTDRQREVLETAYSAGYFEWPREASGEEIAELLEITQPTLNKHLRVAERTAFSLLLEDDGER